MLTLSPDERRALRASAHPLKPVVMIAQNGLTDAVLKEIELALTSHELIKVRVFDAEREQRDAWLAAACEALGAAPIQRIGNILVLYRPNPALHVVAAPPAAPVRKTRANAGDKPSAGKPVPTRSKPAKPVAGRRGVARNAKPASTFKARGR
ncbi:YhbY family RNA-binding protein [Methyloversatilis sp.]|uniref:YhbY family RNA-binding protein n=1 Tax=Methyloversatilis sp. TaxID=2569862 RepID=UPI0027330E5A|nr:YhbY family RNA-binding protein [Methyloversatilis sp.]MDP2867707.1 YhbY family RNA-binding protein [Methyloversatilis sp.]MDP3455528.1 YhbY family RNA-binding protein [Methyloversatilis sp.]MDP3579977.1 YhbY family RNA-binding protein [Methyloversatilis sp.]